MIFPDFISRPAIVRRTSVDWEHRALARFLACSLSGLLSLLMTRTFCLPSLMVPVFTIANGGNNSFPRLCDESTSKEDKKKKKNLPWFGFYTEGKKKFSSPTQTVLAVERQSLMRSRSFRSMECWRRWVPGRVVLHPLGLLRQMGRALKTKK